MGRKSKAVDEQLWNELYQKCQDGKVTAVEFMGKVRLSENAFYKRMEKENRTTP